MAIRFDPAYNKEIRRVVRNFNQKRNRAIKRGFTNLPPAMSVRELKSRYTNRRDLNRDLKLIAQFNQEDALESVETSGGVKAINWELKYVKSNINKAKQYLDREIANLSSLDVGMSVSNREILNNLIAKRSHLELEMDLLGPADYRTTKSIVYDYLNENYHRESSYRGWLNEVEIIMRHLGYDEKTIDKFFEGMDELTPNQFLTMYRQSNLVGRIYELYLPTRGGFKLSTTEDDAKELVDTFMEEKDEMIKRAKQQDEMDTGLLDEFHASLNKPGNKKPLKRPPLRKSRAEVTRHDIEMIEALGGTIEDLLK